MSCPGPHTRPVMEPGLRPAGGSRPSADVRGSIQPGVPVGGQQVLPLSKQEVVISWPPALCCPGHVTQPSTVPVVPLGVSRLPALGADRCSSALQAQRWRSENFERPVDLEGSGDDDSFPDDELDDLYSGSGSGCEYPRIPACPRPQEPAQWVLLSCGGPAGLSGGARRRRAEDPPQRASGRTLPGLPAAPALQPVSGDSETPSGPVHGTVPTTGRSLALLSGPGPSPADSLMGPCWSVVPWVQAAASRGPVGAGVKKAGQTVGCRPCPGAGEGEMGWVLPRGTPGHKPRTPLPGPPWARLQMARNPPSSPGSGVGGGGGLHRKPGSGREGALEMPEEGLRSGSGGCGSGEGPALWAGRWPPRWSFFQASSMLALNQTRLLPGGSASLPGAP